MRTNTYIGTLIGAALLFPAVALAQGSNVGEETNGINALRHQEANELLSKGRFEEARTLYYILLRQNPKDAVAMREAGRASHALGELELAVQEINAALELQGTLPDPELHYLIGEAYYALGKKKKARKHHEIAAAQLGPDPKERMRALWLGRILARSKKIDEADQIYLRILRREGRKTIDEEVAFARIEARTFVKDWQGAEHLLREILANIPDHRRAREMLAWALEAQGRVDEERKVRAGLANGAAPIDAAKLVDHARSLERSHRYRAAIGQYEEALAMEPENGKDIRKAIARLSNRLSPETSVGAGIATDPSGDSRELRAAVALPIVADATVGFGARLHLADGALNASQAQISSLHAAVLLGQGHPVTTALSVSGSFVEFGDEGSTTRLGTGVDVRINQGKTLQFQAQAELNAPWREAASTIAYGGSYSGVTGHVYALPFGNRLIFDLGARLRTMELETEGIASMDEQAVSDGSQALLLAGVDWVPWADPTKVARGEVLDNNMVWPAYMADSLVFSFRHYEAFTRDDFGPQLVMSERNQIDEGSATYRKTFADGIVGGEVRAGYGYDIARDTQLWRVGSSLVVSPSENSRLTLSYDLAQESTSGFVGKRETGWVNIHVDI